MSFKIFTFRGELVHDFGQDEKAARQWIADNSGEMDSTYYCDYCGPVE